MSFLSLFVIVIRISPVSSLSWSEYRYHWGQDVTIYCRNDLFEQDFFKLLAFTEKLRILQSTQYIILGVSNRYIIVFIPMYSL